MSLDPISNINTLWLRLTVKSHAPFPLPLELFIPGRIFTDDRISEAIYSSQCRMAAAGDLPPLL
jgi:hypothetical protein